VQFVYGVGIADGGAEDAPLLAGAVRTAVAATRRS
jgi:hypothetical protein